MKVLEADPTVPPPSALGLGAGDGRLDRFDALRMGEALGIFIERFYPLFRREEQRHHATLYLQGLLSDLERKSVEPMALHLEGGNVRGMQQFLTEGRWSDAEVRREHQRFVNETLGEDDGVLIVDESAFPKKGDDSVGVARQDCGATGKVDNCQVGVYVGYASAKGQTLLDGRLYCRRCG